MYSHKCFLTTVFVGIKPYISLLELCLIVIWLKIIILFGDLFKFDIYLFASIMVEKASVQFVTIDGDCA